MDDLATIAVNLNAHHPYDIYIGRAGRGRSGEWGNPFIVGVHGTREECVAKFRRWVWNADAAGSAEATEERRQWILDNAHTLRGKRLGCFCKPAACHGDVLAELADMTEAEVAPSVPMHTENINVLGDASAELLIVCDSIGAQTWETGKVMPDGAFDFFARHAHAAGINDAVAAFVTPSPPMPETCVGSDKRENAFIKQYHEEFRRAVAQFPNVKLIVCLGATATKQTLNRPCKITRVRGAMIRDTAYGVPVLPVYSPGHVLRQPHYTEIFETDLRTAGVLAANEWNPDAVEDGAKSAVYEWCLDLQPLLDNPPRMMAVDTESKGGRWYRGGKIIVTQITYREGHALLVPLDCDYWPGLGMRKRAALVDQLRRLLGPEYNIPVTGHNFGSDIHMFRKEGITVANWMHDSMQLAFVNDENMLEKSLAESTRRWVPELAGYSDAFDAKTDKEHMELVPHEDMRLYGGGDTDSCFRLTNRLVREARKDARNYNCYRRIQMPALRMFPRMEEHGMRVDKDALRALGGVVEKKEKELYENLIVQVPDSIKRRHADAGLKFSRPVFTIDCLFTPEGRGLTPIVFTKGTKALGEADRIPSTSAKDHLPYFEEDPFVKTLIEYQKLQKLRTSYVGWEGGKLIPQRRQNAAPKYTKHKGFWQYLSDSSCIHPSLFLHDTLTGRTNSRYPNGQNFPKRGDLAEAFRKIFIPPVGWGFVEADLSQAELRIAAWMAQEPTMLAIYNAAGGDIHTATACLVMGITPEAFKRLPKDVQKLKRYHAKAINFGLIYGMGWKKFRVYAKTTYRVDFTEEEAQRIRKLFFQYYSGLTAWHEATREFARNHGYVRALHGALRRLPNIHSPDEGIRGQAERQAINSPVQRFGSDLGLIGLTRFGRDCDWRVMRPAFFIHDSVIVAARLDHMEEAGSALKFYMQSAPLREWFGITPPLPILSDVSMSEVSLGDMQEREDIEACAPEWYRPELDLAA